jgi:uncharacterized protein (DUF305 family)
VVAFDRAGGGRFACNYQKSAMKKIVLVFSLALGISACNNNEGDHDAMEHNEDSMQHGGMTGHVDSTGGSNSMMVIMQKNMDEMKSMPSSSNPDQDFAKMMKVHHMGAVEMVNLELEKGTDPQMKAMAQKMQEEQQKEIEELNKQINEGAAVNGGDAFHKEVTMQMNAMRMGTDHSSSIDKQFAEMMIPHHQGAIDMSKSYLKNGAKNETLKTMANKIIADQQKEIEELEQWIKKQK